ncbi:uncharacterized protein LOC117818035 [Xyrichtys novacula]|uniref:Uncharacterized protein LOC117818035 n=1 Tax=Xyrichtys novacula TaxID=13765 RepID=A0AAV1FCT4_XYRNO|nr:uncharacterized protein LOC117818035 [Xyrichtys novacula]
MIVLWVTLLLLHQAYALIPVETVPVGESVTFMCVFPDMLRETICWYKQRAGETLKLIVRLHKNMKPEYEQEFPALKFNVNMNKNTSNLIISNITSEDEGMYHCRISEWNIETSWSATYLSVTGNTKKTSDLTVVQSQTVSDPVHPGDSLSLQCSVLSDSENQTCSGSHRVFWFRAGSDRSHPDLIYTDGNKQDDCDQRSDPQKSCVYHFSKSVSSSDNGTYYCAVATCGRILFGDGARVDIKVLGNSSPSSYPVIFLLSAVLALSLIVITSLIYCIKKKKKNNYCNASLVMQNNCDGWRSQLLESLKREEVYSAAVFTVMSSERGTVKRARAAEKERIYAAVRAFGFE